jgi:hypothetical protein
MAPEDLTQTVACSAARGFYSMFSYVKMKVDEPIKVKFGYSVYQGSTEEHETPRTFGWGIPVVVLIQATSATALAIGATVLSTAMLF